MRNNLFESVRFLNESEYVYIECDLLESRIDIFNELKFIKKNDVPKEFKDEALKICETLEKEGGRKGSEGFGAATIQGAYGIRINNAHKKIENGKIKNCYILSFSHKAFTKATGTERKVLDNFLINNKLIFDYLKKTLIKLGYKKVSEKPGAYDTYYKKGKNCIYSVDACVMESGTVSIYIRCLEDTDKNKADLVGGAQYY